MGDGSTEMKIARYELGKVIGSGSFGRAMLAANKETGMAVIVKEVHLGNMPESEAGAACEEVLFLSQICHPNVVDYHDSFIDGLNLMIVMEFADGGDLSAFLEHQNGCLMSEAEVLDLFVQIVLGTKACHDLNVLHRDLKPGNIFMCKTGILKLGDFGISKNLGSATGTSKESAGTPYYLPPEVCNGEMYSFGMDVWAMGIILFELCMLQRPFTGKNLPALMMRIVFAAPVPIGNSYSDELRAVVAGMLQKEERKRPLVQDCLGPLFKDAFMRYARRLRFVGETAKALRQGLTPDDAAKGAWIVSSTKSFYDATEMFGTDTRELAPVLVERQLPITPALDARYPPSVLHDVVQKFINSPAFKQASALMEQKRAGNVEVDELKLLSNLQKGLVVQEQGERKARGTWFEGEDLVRDKRGNRSDLASQYTREVGLGLPPSPPK